MKFLVIFAAVATCTVLAGPVADAHELPNGAGAEHDHLRYHLRRNLEPRHGLDARALGGNAPASPGLDSGSPPASKEESSPVAGTDETPDKPANDAVPRPQAKEDSGPKGKSSPPKPEQVAKPPMPVKDVDALENKVDGDVPSQPHQPIDKQNLIKKVLEFLDKLFGKAKNGGPSAGWRNHWDNSPPAHPVPPAVPIPPPNAVENAPAQVPPSSSRHRKTIVVYETELIVVTSTITPSKGHAAAPASSPPEAPSKPAADSDTNADALANKKPPAPVPAPVPAPAAKAAKPQQNPQPKPAPKQEPKPAPKVEAPPQPKPKPQTPPPKKEEAPAPPANPPAAKQQPAKPPPQPKPASKPQGGSTSGDAPPKKQGKPQPTKEQPAGAPGSALNTDGLPLEFVKDLDCHSEIYKGLSKLHHDIHRTNHSLETLGWNDTLFEYAKETAETCVYAHSLTPGGGGYGQNIAAGDAPGNISAVLTNAYYNLEIMKFYNAIGEQWGTNDPDMTNFEEWGHFTQMLWKDTTSFACYTATCSPPGQDPLECDGSGNSYLQNVGCGNGGTQAYFTVCNYYPPGNYAGQYSSVPGPDGIHPFVEMTGSGIIGM